MEKMQILKYLEDFELMPDIRGAYEKLQSQKKVSFSFEEFKNFICSECRKKNLTEVVLGKSKISCKECY